MGRGVNDLRNSHYLGKDDFGPEGATCVIARVVVEELEDFKKKTTELKDVIYFSSCSKSGVDLKKGVVLNLTNGKTIARLTGEDLFDDWIGKSVEFYNMEEYEFEGKFGAVRVRKASQEPPF